MTLAPLKAASAHFMARLPALREAARLGPILDLACGRGRQSLRAAEACLPVIGLDRSRAFLSELGSRAEAAGTRVDRVRCDLEASAEIPIREASCGGILVYRFLFRPLAPAIEAALAPGGLLLYETFTKDQQPFGHVPKNPAFLLASGELPTLFPGLEVIEYAEGTDETEHGNAVAQLTARKPG